MSSTEKIIAVFGGSECSLEVYQLAEEVGRLLAERGALVICGGLSGVMEAVCKGASESGGTTIGILPGDDIHSANQYVKIPVATGMGIGRNTIIARSADACIAINGKYGTLSEIAFALQLEKTVVTLDSWDNIAGTISAPNPQEAIELIFRNIS
jgi:uncharacterized protein (TIGR00725 family)